MTDGNQYGMTKRQHDMLRFIETYIQENGYSPSFQEIMEDAGLRSKSGVHRVVHALRERGLVHMVPDRSRSIALGPTMEQSLAGIGL